jgi:1-acyl-sn-glycerol-3-phosphate acyltransferase
MPARSHIQRGYCRLMLRALGVRITVSGGPIPQFAWRAGGQWSRFLVDIFSIGAVMPGSFVAKAELISWPGLRCSCASDEGHPHRAGESAPVACRRRDGGHSTARGTDRGGFPEGTTWCGLSYGQFRPAMFQAAVDAGRPVQPLRLNYHHRDGKPSTVAAYVGDDTLIASIRRLVTARRTIVHVRVESLQLPGTDRRDLAARCETAVRGDTSRRAHGSALAA